MTASEIQKALPHTYPFLLVDRIIEAVPYKHIVGLKNVTMNEPFFQGHFPGNPIMPGVLIIEAMAQTGCLLYHFEPDDAGRRGMSLLVGLDKVRLRKSVVPGDQLRFDLHMLRLRSQTRRFAGVATVDGDVVAEAEIMAVIMPPTASTHASGDKS
ncbi:MAG: 3-hydroxyacyl-ACP dehydratase FabZ [Myxococcales bacterium]|nr:3-hydroxyacyl-ACP dehydratase FabZ [Myxococcales bacterium]